MSYHERALARFNSKWEPVTESGCWVWTGSTGRTGYGYIGYEGKVIRAHRASYQFFRGAVPEGMSVCHRCDVRCCVNPAHLFIATHQENMRDLARKGRANNRAAIQARLISQNAPKGSKHGMALMTEEKVLELRALRASGVPVKELGPRFGISWQQAYGIVCGNNWKHLPGAIPCKPNRRSINRGI
jgi:hypothetical protein